MEYSESEVEASASWGQQNRLSMYTMKQAHATCVPGHVFGRRAGCREKKALENMKRPSIIESVFWGVFGYIWQTSQSMVLFNEHHFPGGGKYSCLKPIHIESAWHSIPPTVFPVPGCGIVTRFFHPIHQSLHLLTEKIENLQSDVFRIPSSESSIRHLSIDIGLGGPCRTARHSS